MPVPRPESTLYDRRDVHTAGTRACSKWLLPRDASSDLIKDGLVTVSITKNSHMQIWGNVFEKPLDCGLCLITDLD